jgi:cobalt/nickel transport system permease protein
MHLSDGFLDTPTVLATSVAAAGCLGVSLWQLRREMQQGTATASAGQMAIVGAAVFAAQAINFPLAEGVSGHLLGGVAAAALLGPWAGTLVVSAVLIIQCLLLGDGGVTALGANILNMAVLGGMLGAPIRKLRQNADSQSRRAMLAAIAGAAALPLGALACAIELQISGKASFAATAGEMLPLHFLLGVAEGLFTAAAVMLAARSAASESTNARRGAIAFVAVLALTAILVPYSSALPDTLEAAVEQLGVIAAEPQLAAAIDDSTFAAAGDWATAALPILMGMILASGAVVLLARGLGGRQLGHRAIR